MSKLIIVYSKTGNTLGVASKLANHLSCELEEIKAVSNDPNQTYVKLTHIPKTDNFDHLIIGSPVHGFMMPKITKAYLEELSHLDGKEIDLFVTHFFPFSFLGGTQTLKNMKKMIESKGGIVKHMTSINWKSKKREKVIEEMIARYQI